MKTKVFPNVAAASHVTQFISGNLVLQRKNPKIIFGWSSANQQEMPGKIFSYHFPIYSVLINYKLWNPPSKHVLNAKILACNPCPFLLSKYILFYNLKPGVQASSLYIIQRCSCSSSLNIACTLLWFRVEITWGQTGHLWTMQQPGAWRPGYKQKTKLFFFSLIQLVCMALR